MSFFSGFKTKLIKMFLPKPEDLIPMLAEWLASMYYDTRPKMLAEIKKAVKKSFLESTATDKEIDAFVKAVEKWCQSDEFEKVMDKGYQLTTK